MRALLCALVAFSLACSALAYVPSDATRYAAGMHLKGVEIKDRPEYAISNFTRQWTYDIYYNNKNWKNETYVLHRCNGTTSSSNLTWEALPTWGAPCNRLPHPTQAGATTLIKQGDGWRIKLRFRRTNSTGGMATFKRYKNWTMDHVIVRLDIANQTAYDRGWRKKNGLYPKYGQHVRFDYAFPASQLETIMSSDATVFYEHIFDMDSLDELPSVVMYPEVCVVCTKPDGSSDFCQCDRANANNKAAAVSAKTFETEAIMGITSGMRIAAIICSIFSAAFFIIYYIADHFYYNKTGKALALY